MGQARSRKDSRNEIGSLLCTTAGSLNIDEGDHVCVQ